MNKKIILEDFEEVSEKFTLIKEFQNSEIMITGATGLVGSLIVKFLLFCSEKYSLNITIYAVVRSVEKAKLVFEEIKNDSLFFKECDLINDEFVCDKEVDYIIHAAAITTSKEMINNPVDNIKTSLLGTMKILDFAKERCRKSILYLSSMEAYGQMNITDHLIEEMELGYLDLDSVRSCYPEGKRMCECMCKSYSKQYGINIICVRLAQTFGPGVSENDNRIFAQIAKSVIQNENIVLHTEGKSEGNYVYTMDAATAILTLLLKGKKGETYNVTNEENHMSIAGMAEMVASEIAKNRIKVIYDIPKNLDYGYARDTKMHLSSKKINQIGWEAKTNLKNMYVRLIEYLK